MVPFKLKIQTRMGVTKWSSAPCELQEARELTECNPPILVPKGELVADGTHQWLCLPLCASNR
jgi:hypothetical protein